MGKGDPHKSLVDYYLVRGRTRKWCFASGGNSGEWGWLNVDYCWCYSYGFPGERCILVGNHRRIIHEANLRWKTDWKEPFYCARKLSQSLPSSTTSSTPQWSHIYIDFVRVTIEFRAPPSFTSRLIMSSLWEDAMPVTRRNTRQPPTLMVVLPNLSSTSPSPPPMSI